MSNRIIIATCGFSSSGKDTISDFIVKTYPNFRKVSFAGNLKAAIGAIFNYDKELLEGQSVESREWRESIDVFWSKKMGREVTPRKLLQFFGTEIMRMQFHSEIWVNAVEHKIVSNPDVNFVVSDLRFQNEMVMLKNLGANIWNIRQKKLPVWWDEAVKYNNNLANSFDTSLLHISEYEWIRANNCYDEIIQNTFGKLQETFDCVNNLINNKLNSM